MLLAGEIRQIGPLRYKSTLEFRSFVRTATEDTLKELARRPELFHPEPAFYPGQFTIESPDHQKRYTERLESPEHLALRVMANLSLSPAQEEITAS